MLDFNRFPILLAPMAGITDLPFRELCAEFGADFTYTEMISAKGLFYDSKNTRDLLALCDLEAPCGIQLFGSDPEIMAGMAKAVCGEYRGRIALIDLNMGCPAHKIVKNGEGCALMRKPLLAAKIIDSVRRAADVPITVKFRKGWDSGSVNAVEFAKMAEQSAPTRLPYTAGRENSYTRQGRLGYSGFSKKGRKYTGNREWGCVLRKRRLDAARNYGLRRHHGSARRSGQPLYI